MPTFCWRVWVNTLSACGLGQIHQVPIGSGEPARPRVCCAFAPPQKRAPGFAARRTALAASKLVPLGAPPAFWSAHDTAQQGPRNPVISEKKGWDVSHSNTPGHSLGSGARRPSHNETTHAPAVRPLQALRTCSLLCSSQDVPWSLQERHGTGMYRAPGMEL